MKARAGFRLPSCFWLRFRSGFQSHMPRRVHQRRQRLEEPVGQLHFSGRGTCQETCLPTVAHTCNTLMLGRYPYSKCLHIGVPSSTSEFDERSHKIDQIFQSADQESRIISQCFDATQGNSFQAGVSLRRGTCWESGRWNHPKEKRLNARVPVGREDHFGKPTPQRTEELFVFMLVLKSVFSRWVTVHWICFSTSLSTFFV